MAWVVAACLFVAWMACVVVALAILSINKTNEDEDTVTPYFKEQLGIATGPCSAGCHAWDGRQCHNAFCQRGAANPPQAQCQHVLYTTQDKDRPDEICDRNGEVVLSLCKLCGKAEAELIEQPGVASS